MKPRNLGVGGIIALIVSAFFFYMVGVLAFVGEGPGLKKAVIMAVFSLPAFFFLIVGTGSLEGRRVRRNIGIVLLSAAAMCGLVAYMAFAMSVSPEMSQFISKDSMSFFSDYRTGFGGIILYSLLGGFLVYQSRTPRPINPPPAPPPAPGAD